MINYFLIATLLVAGSLNTTVAKETNRGDNIDRPLNCDSTCIIPDGYMLSQLPKGNTVKANPITATPNYKPICGPSAGSVLTSAPNNFLCSNGTASNVSTINNDGETIYAWNCSNNLGTQSCMAQQRAIGSCGSSHGQNLMSNPTNLCSSGQSYGFNLNNNQYTWGCAGNYGSPAYCSATYTPPDLTRVVYTCGFGYTLQDTCSNPANHMPLTIKLTMKSATHGQFSWLGNNVLLCTTGEPTWITTPGINLHIYNQRLITIEEFKSIEAVTYSCGQTG